MAASGMITFALLVALALIDHLNGQSVNSKVVFKPRTRTAIIKWTLESSLLSNALHLYKGKSQGGLERIVHFDAGATKGIASTSKYTGLIGRSQVTLTISKLEPSDEGTYFYAHWDTDDRKIFGSGTRLIVTEPGKDNVVTPKLTGYLNQATKKPVALCQARDMFPDLVSFKWEKSSNGGWSEVPKEQIVEQSHNEDPVTSMVILNTEDSTYRCTVTHEGSSKNPEAIEIKRDEKPSVNKPIDVPDATCPPSTDETPISQESDNPEKKQSLQLFVYGYAVMLMKNVLYFIVVFIVLLKRKAGKKEERS